MALLVATLPFNASADTQDQEFPMPALPEQFDSEVARADYIVTHFWDRVKLDTAIKNRAGFSRAFNNYVMQMPFATESVTKASIDKLTKAFAKDPSGMLTLAEIAEETLYSPSAIITSDDFYLPFAKAVVNSKKISSANKARFARQAKILEGCKIGVSAPDFEFQTLNGERHKLSDFKGKHIILFINDPECDDCALARVRLSVDGNINRFIDAKQLELISIYPNEPDDEWRTAAATYNPRWIIGASDKIDDILDMRSTPTIYYLSPDLTILSKTISVEQLLTGFERISSKN